VFEGGGERRGSVSLCGVPGCLLLSLVASIVPTVLLNVIVRL
jgi:hypothetical protein